MTARGGARIRVGISACLLGQEVRYDGGHKRDRYITDTLGHFFEWVPVCPELEMGLGVPRETLRLEGSAEAPRLVFRQTRGDITGRMESWSRRRLTAIESADLCGYILKSDSPSCGMERVRVHRIGHTGPPARKGVGLFARALMDRFPLLPVEEEGRLHDLALRDNFVERVFCYRRLRDLAAAGVTRGRLVAFHTAHKLLLMAHSPKHYAALGRLVARAKDHAPAELLERYGASFMEALEIPATPPRHTNVLQHVFGYLKRVLAPADGALVLEVIQDYHHGLVPLVVPLTLLKHHLKRANVGYVLDQFYLNPHPKELMLRNHV